MKKAKIMLMTIGIVGVIGGAFAFKASKFTAPTVAQCKTTVAGGSKVCVLLPYGTVTNANTSSTFSSIFTNAPVGGANTACPSTTSTVNCITPNAIPTSQKVYFND